MKSRTLNIIQFLTIVFLLLHITNVEYRKDEKCKVKNAEIVDQYLDLQEEYMKTFNEVIHLEEENLQLQDQIIKLEHNK
jgi:cell division septum initiation protein DivIVA